jgi:hypothetical protein
MAADDSLYAGEAETGPPTDFFGREEGIEYPRLHSGLDADAVVPHLHERHIAPVYNGGPNVDLDPWCSSRDVNKTIPRVDTEIEQHLFQLTRIAVYLWGIIGNSNDKLDASVETAAANAAHRVDHHRQIRRYPL